MLMLSICNNYHDHRLSLASLALNPSTTEQLFGNQLA